MTQSLSGALRRPLHLAVGAALAVALIGFSYVPAQASEATDDSVGDLTLSATTWNPGKGAATKNIKVTTSASEWTAAADTDWITATVTKAGVKIKVTKNEGSARTGTVTVTAGSASQAVVVTQATAIKAEKPTLTVEPKKRIKVVNEGGQVQYTVTTNQPGWVAVSQAEWVHVVNPTGVSGDVLTVVADPGTGKARTGKITLTAGTKKITLRVREVKVGKVLTLTAV
ncbi:MAG: BACON domain-containing protein [Propionibacteriaceae bacterium]|jgi:hypothetical protein|nr:BACON domain-containing protein [Propionibacteriaceae bacterium]